MYSILQPLPSIQLAPSSFISEHFHHLHFSSLLVCRRDFPPFRKSAHISFQFQLFEKSSRLYSFSVEDDSTSSICEEDCFLEEARQAVSQLLAENGISPEMAVAISSASPDYLKMLIQSVRELDELSLWSSWRGEGELGAAMKDDGSLSFKTKVYYMAKEKSADGILPFLESIGLSLSASMNVARYLSHETLPALVSKVSYMKEMFFSDSDDDDDILIGHYARRIMTHLSIPMDEDLHETLSFFEKIEARCGGLNILNSKDDAFRYLIESFPRLLLLSLDNQIKPLVKFLEGVGVPRRSMRSVLLLFPPIIFYDIERHIKPRLQLFKKIDAAGTDYPKMLVKYPWIISKSAQKNCEDVLMLFDSWKVPKECAHQTIRSWPHVLGSSTERLEAMMKQLDDLGIHGKMGRVISRTPQLLLRKPEEFLQVVSFLKGLGLDGKSVGQVLCRCPEITVASIEKTLKPKLEYLTHLGISEKHFPRIIKKYPEVFFYDNTATLSSRIKYLTDSGLSRKEVASMVKRFSPLLGYSIENVFRPKLQFLLNDMGKPVKDVVDYPRYFSYSLEKKIKPRFYILKGRNVDCSLEEMLGMNDEAFADQHMGMEHMLVLPR